MTNCAQIDVGKVAGFGKSTKNYQIAWSKAVRHLSEQGNGKCVTGSCAGAGGCGFLPTNMQVTHYKEPKGKGEMYYVTITSDGSCLCN